MQRKTVNGLHFIRVQGSMLERARAHVQLMKAELRDGVFPALEKKNEWMIRRAPGLLLQNPMIQNLVVRLYKKLLMRCLEFQLTDEEKTTLKCVSNETGISLEVCREILFQPDGLMLLARTTLMKHLLPEWIPGSLPGCTSGVTLKNWTRDGRLLAGRNFDYLIVGPWERHTTVVFNEPSDPSEIPFTFITSAGIHSGGLTSMNREGLTLFTHAHFGKKVSLTGRPVIPMGDEIIRKAKTIGQAVDLAKKYPPSSNWAFVVTSARENHAAVIEWSADGVRVRDAADGFLAHSNFYHDKGLQKNEALMSGAYCEDLQARFCRIRQILEPLKGKLEPSHFAAAMGDHLDFFSGQERVLGNTVGVVTTIKSAVFDPELQKIWVASRGESPVGLGDYVEVKVDEFWKQSTAEYESTREILPGYRPKNPQLIEGMRHYRNAYQAYHMKNDQDDYQAQALGHLRKAVAAYPSDGHLWLQAGIVAFKLKEFREAQSYFEGARARVVSHHIGYVRDLYLARCWDLAGLRAEALQVYRKHSEIQEPKLKKAFQRGLKRPFRTHESSNILVDLQYPDTFQY